MEQSFFFLFGMHIDIHALVIFRDFRIKIDESYHLYYRIRLDTTSGDFARQRTKKRSREASHERFYGVGAGSKAKTRRPVSAIAQRRVVEDAGKIVEVI